MIETLDRYVTRTLESLGGWEIPEVPVGKGLNLFMGSGNASQVAGIFANHFGGFAANAASFPRFVEYADRFDERVVISASGGKDAVRMAEAFRGDCLLLTCAENPPAAEFAKQVVTFPSLKEPPSYNVSTYASMFRALAPRESIGKISRFVGSMGAPQVGGYSFIPVIASDCMEPLAQMCATKIRETLGIGSVGKGVSEAAHGWFLHDRPGEFALCLNVPEFEPVGGCLRVGCDSLLGLMLSVYHIVGKSQTARHSEEIVRNYGRTSRLRGWKFGDVL
jgi:hypothetical protein